MTLEVRLGSDFETTTAVTTAVEDRVASRLFAHDATLWGAAAEAEAAIRLGWTNAASQAEDTLAGIAALREDFSARNIDRIVLCGMGGSSLAPEVITRRSGVDLVVLDSTHPAQVRRALDGDLSRTAVVVSSKSGSTIETRSHRAVFETAFREAGIDPADRIVVVTDPGSPLEASARAAGQRVFLADPNVGGRYSALTAFGLVPSGLAGVDLRTLLDEANAVTAALASDLQENPALQLAAAIASGLPSRFALAIEESEDARWGLGDWIEQLIAESTGKEGKGVLPVVLSASAPETVGSLPATAVRVTVAENAALSAAPDAITVTGSLGAQLVLWETATAVLGRLMGIDPFNQPDVESAKIAAREALASDENSVAPLATFAADGEAARTEVLAVPGQLVPSTLDELVTQLREVVQPGSYVSVQAYLDREAEGAATIQGIRDSLAGAFNVPVTFGWGPRFLHSTGQLHKGGPAVGVFIQLLDDAEPELQIPDAEAGFGALIAAQARGDRRVLADHGLPVFALRTSDSVRLAQALATALAGSRA